MKGKKHLIIILVIVGWQLIAWLEIFSPLLFPGPLAIIKQTWTDILSGELIEGLLFSIIMILVASVPSFLLALLMAFLSVKHQSAEKICETLSGLAHPLPGIALLPLLIIWTGLGSHIILLIVIHSVIWPFYINIRNGFRQINPLWLDLGTNNGLSPGESFYHILLPGSLPSLIAGLKIGWARAWRAVISAEMIFGTIGRAGGLGWYIYNKRIFMDTPGMYGGIILLMIIGLIMEKAVFEKAEKAIEIRWGTTP